MKLVRLVSILSLLLCFGMVNHAHAYYTTTENSDIRMFADNSNFGYDPFDPNRIHSNLISRGGLFSAPAIQQPATLTYEVQAGDTLYRIARNFNSTVKDLMAANQIPAPEMLQVGQKLTIISPDALKNLPNIPGESIQKVLTTTLTAYTAGYESTGKSPTDPDYGITSNGSVAKDGETIAVDPNVIPIGSTVYIEGIGIRKAEDTGGAIKGARIDVFMNNLAQAISFGIKHDVKVYVLSTPVNS